MVRKIFFLFLALLWVGGSFCEGSERRVIVLGFDGVDPALLEKFMAQGELPRLASLSASGTYLPLGTTLPPQSPVSWASFATGMNPAKTRIFDFLTRIPGTYYPDFAMVGKGKMLLFPHLLHRLLASLLIGVTAFGAVFLFRKRARRSVFPIVAALFFFGLSYLVFQWIPREIPKPLPRREGESFWTIASHRGIATVLIRVPVTFPPENLPQGRMLSGLGVPDVRKTFGTFSFYTTESVKAEDTEMGGKVIPVVLEGNEIHTFVWGPKNFTVRGEPDLLPELRLVLDREKKHCTIQFQGHSYLLREGEWSPWVPFRFTLNPLIYLYGIGRFYLIEASPVLKLYLSPINFHPVKVPLNFSLSSPRKFSKELAEELGLYKTLGWAEDTWALNEERLDEKAFLEDLFLTEKKIKEIMFHELSQSNWRLFVGVFEGTDRAQHMFWRTIDPQHPAYDASDAEKYGGVILKTYQDMDRTVGEVIDRYVDSDTILFVLSDHGFHSFRRAVNVNTWLVKQGYMTLKGMETARDRNLEDLFGHGEFWPNVDWSKTQAYALGLAGLYINRRGREPQGIVSEKEYDVLRGRLIKDLLQLTDPKTGTLPLLKVYRREEAYSGPYLEETPDLLLGFKEGYRVSWQTALGGIPKEIFEDNRKKWSGDHCSYDPSVTAGVFFCNRRLAPRPIHIMDIAPTILEIFRIPIPSQMDGKSFWSSEARTDGAERHKFVG